MGLGVLAVVAVIAVVAIAVFAVAVAAIAIAAVFAVAAVAVVIAVLALRHVDTVEDDAGVGHLLLLGQGVEEAEGGLRGVVGTADVDGEVGLLAYLDGIGDQTDGGGVEDDIVVVGTEHLDNLLEVVTGQELGGVGGYGTRQEEVEVVVDARLCAICMKKEYKLWKENIQK